MSFFPGEPEKSDAVSDLPAAQPMPDLPPPEAGDQTVQAAPVDAGMPDRPKLRSRNALWRDAAEILLLIVTIYTLVNLATARAIVEGDSMQPNFHPKQLIIVNRFAYYFGEPRRGDVIVLHNPRNTSEDFIKRLIGMPGETIKIKDGRVYANDKLLDEPYIPKFCTAGCDGTWTVGADEYFVLGDNRSNSYDSHMFGPIARNLVVGQAWVRYWPPQDMGMIPHPGYVNLTDQFSAPTTPSQPATETPVPTKESGPSQINPRSTSGI